MSSHDSLGPPDPAVPPVQAPVDEGHFRQAMGRFGTGVTVVTTRTRGHDLAMTASSFTSVSLEPALVLVCVEMDGRWHDAVKEAGVWGVSTLAASARPIAEWLATPGRPQHGQLDRIAFHRGSQTGVALLDGALMTLECRTREIFEAGDHSIVLGTVVDVHTPERSEPALVHYRGRYGALP